MSGKTLDLDHPAKPDSSVTSNNWIFLTTSTGLIYGFLSGTLSLFPQHDFLFGMEFVESFLADLMRVSHKWYVPLSRSIWLLVLYCISGSILGFVAGLLLKVPLIQRGKIVGLNYLIPISGAILATIALVALWIHRGIPVGAVQIAIVLVLLTGIIVPSSRVLAGLLRMAFGKPLIVVGMLGLLTLFMFSGRVLGPRGVKAVDSINPIKPSHPVLLIGLDAASWANLNDQIELGAMPNLERMMQNGSWGELESLPGYYSPSHWTTAVTGLHPEGHGILSFQSENIPYTSNSRNAWALWEILPKFSQRSAFHYWWATWPAESSGDLIVSDRFMMHELDHRVFPSDQTRTLDGYAKEVIPSAPGIGRFLGAEIVLGDEDFSLRHQQKLSLLKESILRDYIVLKLGERALSSNQYDLVGVYFRTIDTAGHKFWKWHYQQESPRLASWIYGGPDRDQESFGPVIGRVNEWTDEVLGRLVQAAGQGTNIVICSDHGMTGVRPDASRQEAETGRHHHSGMLLMFGPDIRKGKILRGASLYDIFPTVLYLLGLPIPEDLNGRPLTEAITAQTLAKNPIQVIGGFGERLTDSSSPLASPVDEDLMDKLRSLGYVK